MKRGSALSPPRVANSRGGGKAAAAVGLRRRRIDTLTAKMPNDDSAPESSGEKCAALPSPIACSTTHCEPASPIGRPRGRVILKMSVQIPDGRKGTIHVFPGDDPKDLASNFCTKYELTDPKLQRLVERHITDSMKNLPQASASRSSPYLKPNPNQCRMLVPLTRHRPAAELGEEGEAVRRLSRCKWSEGAPGQRSGRERSGRELGGSGRDSAAAAAS